jgi:hypothetical protein
LGRLVCIIASGSVIFGWIWVCRWSAGVFGLLGFDPPGVFFASFIDGAIAVVVDGVVTELGGIWVDHWVCVVAVTTGIRTEAVTVFIENRSLSQSARADVIERGARDFPLGITGTQTRAVVKQVQIIVVEVQVKSDFHYLGVYRDVSGGSCGIGDAQVI